METVSNDCGFETEAQQLLEALASGRAFRENLFTVEGLTFEQLYGRMGVLRELITREMNIESPLCLCTQDRSWIAAALLAALDGGPSLLIPHDFNENTLNEAHMRTPFTHALVAPGDQLPDAIKALPWPQKPRPLEQHLPISMKDNPSLDASWLHLFTGGSTGTPQIWSKTPRNLLMEAVYLKKTFDIREDDTILATVPPNHIYGLLYSILLPLVSGARVTVTTPMFPNEIIQGIEKTQATVLISIPAHYRALKSTPFARHPLRMAFSSAGALAEEDSIGFFNNTGISVNEIYGSTETGGIAQRNRAKGQVMLTPFECVDVQIKRDDHLQVRSDFLSDELALDDAGFFETADRAQWGDASGFTLLGRSDGIVKVGGKRVDLAKTRETLMQVDGVEDVYVFAIPVQSGRENEIVALVEGRADIDRINQAANRHLPSYARPRNIKITEQIPLSSTGKYNHTAIKDLFLNDH